MFERLDTTYSKDLLDVLQKVEDKDVLTNTLPFAGPLRDSQLLRNKTFLDTINSPPGLSYVDSLFIEIPTLLAVAKSKKERSDTFYTHAIGVEIHGLLRHMIFDIRNSVKKVYRKQYTGGKGRSVAQEDLPSLVTRISFSCHLLRLFVYSSAAPAHFTTIHPLLKHFRLAQTAERSKKMNTTTNTKPPHEGAAPSASEPSNSHKQNVPALDDIDEELGRDFGDEGEDEDRYELTTANADQVEHEKDLFPIVLLFLQWIRCMVSHTEALNTLCLMAGQMALLPVPPTLSIKVLAVPCTGSQLKPWEDIIWSVWTNGQDPSLTAQEVIDQLHEQQVFRKGVQPLFKGTLHCEACL
jgi:hypothetical protein